VDKTYFAKIDGVVTDEDVTSFETGLDIGEKNLTMPAKLVILQVDEEKGTSEIHITIQEGKFHQVKRMFEAVGKTVTYLKRLSMGSLVLDEGLLPGEARRLTDEEVEGLRKEREK
jgi:16S rRNA pseudouridine516 synthase